MQLTKINGKYELFLPVHRALRPQWDIKNGGWEVQRIEAMLQIIKSHDVVFDIGTEEGDISALIAKYTACDMVLVEPNEKVWPCIKAIWQANDLKEPLDFYSGFFANDDLATELSLLQKTWNGITTDDIIGDHGFSELHDTLNNIPRKRLDSYCRDTGIYPTVITMDVEGSEFEVIKGAENILRAIRPTIFMSVHGAFMYEHHKQHIGDMLKFLHDCGYKHSVIEMDYHELHVLFEPI
jgi:FkbM family methyltransferase